ncbi:P-loop containing nucleoside triphosphate hydrolase protein [Fennellomyces sp. T-0311]|nr:P-loop containing nucleoside triphosphate hydrolase protein [Fennellomyces sp. T-0311]
MNVFGKASSATDWWSLENVTSVMTLWSSVLYIILRVTLLRTKWWDLVESVTDKFRRPPPDTVSVQLITSDKAYIAVDDYVRRKIRVLDGLNRVFATYEEPGQGDGESDDEQADKKPIVTFYPPEEVTNEIEYKGHKLSIAWRSIKKAKDDEDQLECSMFRGRFVSRMLIITMEDTNLDLLKQFIQEWTDIYNERQSNELNVHKYEYSYSSWEHLKSMEPRALGTVVLKEGVKEHIVNDMDKFRRRKRWYKTRGVPYRRGYLLYGPPGTGKTSLIQALASNLGMDIAIASLMDVYRDSDFSDMLADAPHNSIVVLEDFDHYIRNVAGDSNDRTNKSIAGVLNALDGIQGQTGSMIFMTCNDISKLPPALLRPGRMDMKLKLDYADRHQIEEMFWQFFGHDPDTLEPVKEGERKEFLLAKKKEFGKRIPTNHVTTAELESYFIMLWMGADAEHPEKGLYDRIFDGIPEFLEKVKVDREQAKEHERKRSEEARKRAAQEERERKKREQEEKEEEEAWEAEKKEQEKKEQEKKEEDKKEEEKAEEEKSNQEAKSEPEEKTEPEEKNDQAEKAEQEVVGQTKEEVKAEPKDLEAQKVQEAEEDENDDGDSAFSSASSVSNKDDEKTTD